MLTVTMYSLSILVYSVLVIGVSNAASNDNGVFISILNRTTTAVPPLYNGTNLSTNANTQTKSSSKMTLTTQTHTQEPTVASVSIILSKLGSTTVSPIVETVASHQESTTKRFFITTTAAPPMVGPAPSYREFDGLSFAGGALVTIGLVVVGTLAWKMYIAHIERRYWTL